MPDHLGAGAPERERLADRQQRAQRLLNKNQEKAASGRPDSRQLLPGSVSGRPVLVSSISICTLLSHYHTSAHLYSGDAASHLTAQALSGPGYYGSRGQRAHRACFYFLKAGVWFDSAVPGGKGDN